MTKRLYISCQQYSTFLKDTTSKLAKPEAQLQKQNVKLNTPTHFGSAPKIYHYMFISFQSETDTGDSPTIE